MDEIDDTPWYEIQHLIRPRLTQSETKVLRYSIKLIDYYMSQGDYQYVIDNASEKGLYEYVEDILKMKDEEIKLNRALYLAGKNGHGDIVFLLLYHDFKNRSKIFNIAKLLTREDLLYAIRQSFVGHYTTIAIMIQKYYLEMYEEKTE
jgi:hypothetical protein